jgi:L-threonylcarbamoyladenylate synthase
MGPEVFTIDTTHPQAQAIDRAAQVMADGGIALFPTDTVYTVASLAVKGMHISDGIRRLFEFKRRGFGPSFPWLVDSPEALDTYGMSVPDEARRLAEAFWPGGLGIVVKANSAVPHALTHSNGSIALRQSASPVVSGLLRVLDRPLVSTGANEHGVPAPVSFADVAPNVVGVVDVALDGGEGTCQGRSTLVDCTRTPVSILREGVVSREQLNEALGYVAPLV